MRSSLVVVGALLTGLAITWVDSRPTWDDAGVTAFALLAAVVVWTAVVPRLWWLVALLVIVPLPILETGGVL